MYHPDTCTVVPESHLQVGNYFNSIPVLNLHNLYANHKQHVHQLKLVHEHYSGPIMTFTLHWLLTLLVKKTGLMKTCTCTFTRVICTPILKVIDQVEPSPTKKETGNSNQVQSCHLTSTRQYKNLRNGFGGQFSKSLYVWVDYPKALPKEKSVALDILFMMSYYFYKSCTWTKKGRRIK